MLCVEGISDREAIYSASAVLEATIEEPTYTPLDLSGVTVVQCEGDGGVLRYGQFFSGLGLRTYALYDHQRDDDFSEQIKNAFDAAWELEQTGIESLLAEETSIEVIRDFLVRASEWADYPKNARDPGLFGYDPESDDEEVREVCKRVLRRRKGAGYAQQLVELCTKDDLPSIIVEALELISEDLPGGFSSNVDENDLSAFYSEPV